MPTPIGQAFQFRKEGNLMRFKKKKHKKHENNLLLSIVNLHLIRKIKQQQLYKNNNKNDNSVFYER